MQQVHRGQIIQLELQTTTNVNLDDDANIEITDSDDVVRVAAGTGTNIATGRYLFEYTPPLDAPLGTWNVEWTGELDGDPVTAPDVFEVLEEQATPADGSATPVFPIEDVRVLLGRELTDAEEYTAPRLLQIMEAMLADAGQGLTPAAGGETVDVPWDDPTTVWTPRWPVTAIDSVVCGDTILDADQYRWNSKGKIDLRGVQPGWWTFERDPIVGWPILTLTYSWGMATIPADLSGIVAAPVAATLRRQATNPDNILNESLGPYSVAYGSGDQAAAAAGLTPPVLPARWRRNTVVSVPLLSG